jgi:starvation-inducible outer membrane lipoprotein
MNKIITNMILYFCMLLTFCVSSYSQVNSANQPDDDVQSYNLIIKTEGN